MKKNKFQPPSFLHRIIRRALFSVIAYIRARPKFFERLIRIVSRVPGLHSYLKAFYHTHNPAQNSCRTPPFSSRRRFHEGRYFQRQLEGELRFRRQKHGEK